MLAKDIRHLAFADRSLESLGRWRRKLSENGIMFWEEEHGPQRSLYFEDPNGVILEVTAPPSRPGSTESRKACALAEKWIKAAA